LFSPPGIAGKPNERHPGVQAEGRKNPESLEFLGFLASGWDLAAARSGQDLIEARILSCPITS
jgi:hypothetical protein